MTKLYQGYELIKWYKMVTDIEWHCTHSNDIANYLICFELSMITIAMMFPGIPNAAVDRCKTRITKGRLITTVSLISSVFDLHQPNVCILWRLVLYNIGRQVMWINLMYFCLLLKVPNYLLTLFWSRLLLLMNCYCA